MEFRRLCVTVNSATELKDRRHFNEMNVYVVVSLYGDKRYRNKQQTGVHKDGGTGPRWGQTLYFDVDEAAARAGRLTLKFKIKDVHTLFGRRDVGSVDVPVKDLLEQGGGAGDGTPKVMGYWVRLPSGKTKGVLEFSYKFGERFTIDAAANPSSSRSAAGYPRPPQLFGCPPNAAPSYGYPPQGYGYPRPPQVFNAAPTYGYPPQGYGYPRPPQVFGCPPNAAPSYGYSPQGYGYPPPGHQRPPAGGEWRAEVIVVNPMPNYIMPDEKAGDDDEFCDCFIM